VFSKPASLSLDNKFPAGITPVPLRRLPYLIWLQSETGGEITLKQEPYPLTTRRQILIAAAGASLAAACSKLPSGTAERDIAAAMKRATTFMRKRCAAHGGYVWAYAADFSQRWGEMEAYPSMIWIQPPGTATVGHLYLDCYHATGDEYYYDAAVEVALSLIAAQHASGGWNYLYDFAGEDSARQLLRPGDCLRPWANGHWISGSRPRICRTPTTVSR
jgi:hypothetical protein